MLTITVSVQRSGSGVNDNADRNINIPDEADGAAAAEAFTRAAAFLDEQRQKYSK